MIVTRTRRAARKYTQVMFLGIFIFALTVLVFVKIFFVNPIRIQQLRQKVAAAQERLNYTMSLYRSAELQLFIAQERLSGSETGKRCKDFEETIETLRQTDSADRLLTGFNVCKLTSVFTSPLAYQLLPHLHNDPQSTKPAYYLELVNRTKQYEYIIGITTAKREYESFLIITLNLLLIAIGSPVKNEVLIIVMISETNPKTIIEIVSKIGQNFNRELNMGLIRILTPKTAYYPDWNTMTPTLDDPFERFVIRTKQNLDSIFLMSYVQDKCDYFLAIEDDVIANSNFLNVIRATTRVQFYKNPNWIFTEFKSTTGAINGRLFRTSQLPSVITFLQMFHPNMPIEWLLEVYIASRICLPDRMSKSDSVIKGLQRNIHRLPKPLNLVLALLLSDKDSHGTGLFSVRIMLQWESWNSCTNKKLMIRPKYSESLFKEIEPNAYLKRKFHKQNVPAFYPHANPPLKEVKTNMVALKDHSLERLYGGLDFFWASTPKINDHFELVFKQPICLTRYLIKSGNTDKESDIIYGGKVYILLLNGSYVNVGSFDEHGIAKADLPSNIGLIKSLKVVITKVSRKKYWVVISEIDIQTDDDEEDENDI